MRNETLWTFAALLLHLLQADATDHLPKPRMRAEIAAKAEAQRLVPSLLEVYAENTNKAAAAPYVDLLIIVPVHLPDETEKREGIRHSWAPNLDSHGHCTSCNSSRTVKILFMAASNDRISADEDTVLLKFDNADDKWGNLPTKLRHACSHAVKHYRFSLLLKVDSDSFVFMNRFFKFADQHDLWRAADDPRPGIYGGDFSTGTTEAPIEKDNNKWAEPDYTKLTGKKYFPWHAKGAGYLLSPSLVKFIAYAQQMPAGQVADPHEDQLVDLLALHNEDVSVGFWLQPVLKERVDMKVANEPQGCQERDAVIDHRVSPALARFRFEQFAAHGDECTEPAVKWSEQEVRVAMEMYKLAEA